MWKEGYIVRLALVALTMAAAFVFLANHLFTLQVGRHEELLTKARQKYTESKSSLGARGRVYDIHGNLLAGNLACQDIFAEPKWVYKLGKEEADRVLRVFSQELDVPLDLLRQRFKRGRVEVVLKRDAELDRAVKLKRWIQAYNEAAAEKNAPKLRRVRFVETQKRYYPKGSLAANTLGFLNEQGQGGAGIEQLMNQRLIPGEGEAMFERDPRGRRLRNDSEQVRHPSNGWNVYLTIDETIQSIVEEELAGLYEEQEPKAAFAVMANPKTGAVMAMAQLPTFNPNHRGGITRRQWENQILTYSFEPGSVMKGLSLAGALHYNVVNLGSTYYCEKGLWYHAGRRLRDSGHQYENLQVWEIVQKSSNIGTAKIAMDMGPARLYTTLHNFGFGQTTDLGFPGEAAGIFRPLSRWDGLSLSRFAIGQGIAVTPLQIVQGYCALANDGVMMQMRLIDRMEDPASGLVEFYPPKAKHRVVSAAAARQMITAMKTVTKEGGTATRAAVDGFEVAGKTGTAQKFVNQTYDNGLYVASFIGIAPADDPAFVLYVVADEPGGRSHYGGTVAGPTFSRIAERTLRYLQVAPSTPGDSIVLDRVIADAGGDE
ncbi:MAG: penicillin-binding protein 2 [Lentisphaeria bacterium]|nr:penicillin-binding protein 2 [Lentisphaeria bacterium]